MIEIKTYDPQSGDDFIPLMQAANNAWPDFQRTLAEVERDWHMHRKDKFKQAYILTEDGDKQLAVGIGMDAYWVGDINPFSVDIFPFPGVAMDRTRPLADHLEELARERKAPLLQTEVCDIYVDIDKFWRDRAFESKMDGFVSRLDIQAFDRSRVASGLQKFTESGMKIASLVELDWEDMEFQRKYYDLRWEINQDIPNTDTPQRETFERFQEMWLSGNIVPRECIYFAMDGDELAGYTNGRPLEGMPEKFDTFTTGVARKYRRNGVATALKVRIIEWCKANGYRWIETGNEVNNPMYDLNVALGFEHWCNFCILEKPVA